MLLCGTFYLNYIIAKRGLIVATKEILTRIQCKCDTSANWEANNPILLQGEVAIVNDSSEAIQLKIGDGTSSYTSLPFVYSLPVVVATDDGKVLTISNGSVVWQTPTYNIQTITQTEYDALTAKDENTLYIIEV